MTMLRGNRWRPNVVSFVRYLDLLRRDAGFDSIAVRHFWVGADYSADHNPEAEEAEAVLEGVGDFLAANPFPIVGEHCRECTGMRCRPDLAGVDVVGKAPDLFATSEPATPIGRAAVVL
jgi:hypothetical protein